VCQQRSQKLLPSAQGVTKYPGSVPIDIWNKLSPAIEDVSDELTAAAMETPMVARLDDAKQTTLRNFCATRNSVA